MLYWIYEEWRAAFQEGAPWAVSLKFLNLLQYITFRAALATILSFVLSLLLGPRVIRRLISLKVGQPIRSAEEVHKLAELHGGKAGTPTMGGVLILGSVLISVLVCGRPLNPFVAVTTCVMLAMGLLGFVDDYTKVVQKDSAGVSARQKLCWQALIASLGACFIFFKKEVSGFSTTAGESGLGFYMKMGGESKMVNISELCFPLWKQPMFDIGYLAIPFFVLIIVGCSNAVNLTDGLDGLATGCTVTVSLAYAALAYLGGHFYMAHEYLFIPYNPLLSELSVLMMGLVGAGMGFLWFNCHPAKVFMGDTGSLAIGGGLGMAAICTKQEILLMLIGGVFVMEAMSVIMQVASFKLRGKRIFAMSPIHHHFELRGWHESQVITRFWILSIVFAMGGLALLKIL